MIPLPQDKRDQRGDADDGLEPAPATSTPPETVWSTPPYLDVVPRLFAAARRDLMQSGLKSMVIWALSDNDPATEFYRALGGRMVARSSEKFGPKSLDKVAFAWTN